MEKIAKPNDAIIVGGGASGLMCARELVRAGKSVTVVEARERLGGRVHTLAKEENAIFAHKEAGAEFIHGDAPITRTLAQEFAMPIADVEGEVWSARGQALSQEVSYYKHIEAVREKLLALKEDMSVATFFDTHPELQFARHSITKLVSGYLSADLERMSCLGLARELIDKDGPSDARIVGGYGALINKFAQDIEAQDGAVLLGEAVQSITHSEDGVIVTTIHGTEVRGKKCVLSVPPPLVKEIKFDPPLSVCEEFSKLGYGAVVKVLINFSSDFLDVFTQRNMQSMSFLLGDEPFLTFWSTTNNDPTTLVAWMAGKDARTFSKLSSSELAELALSSLAKTLNLDSAYVKTNCNDYYVTNWTEEPYTQGAYSYTALNSEGAKEVLRSHTGAIYFAGEALAAEDISGTVEGALSRGREVAEKIINE